MTNARKGPSGGGNRVATVQISGDVITLSPTKLQDTDVLRIDVTAPGTHTIHGMAPGRNGQKIRILASGDTGAGDFSLPSESGSALPGTQWFSGPALTALIPPSNFEATYDAITAKWWVTGTVLD